MGKILNAIVACGFLLILLFAAIIITDHIEYLHQQEYQQTKNPDIQITEANKEFHFDLSHGCYISLDFVLKNFGNGDGIATLKISDKYGRTLHTEEFYVSAHGGVMRTIHIDISCSEYIKSDPFYYSIISQRSC